MNIILFIIGVLLIGLLIFSMFTGLYTIYCQVIGFLVPMSFGVLADFMLGDSNSILNQLLQTLPYDFVWVLIGLFAGGGLFLLFSYADIPLTAPIGCTLVTTGVLYLSGLFTGLIPNFILEAMADSVISVVAWTFLPLLALIGGFGWLLGIFD